MPPTNRVTLPLTPMQAGMLLETHLSEHTGVYLQQFIGNLYEPLDLERLRNAWDDLAQRHPALRIRFQEEDDGAWTQSVYPNPNASFTVLDWQSQSLEQCEKEFSAFIDRDRIQGFNFESDAPHRLVIILFPDQQARILWTVHHSVLDRPQDSSLLIRKQNLVDGPPQRIGRGRHVFFDERVLGYL